MIATRPDRVQIWASQLTANDFPPVCAMTGAPAETWRKFRFATPPRWAYALLALICLGGLGFVAFAVVVAAVAQRASGYLPLTKRSRLMLNLVFWLPIGLIAGWLVLWVAAAVIGLPSSDPTLTTIAAMLFWLGTLAMIAGVVGRFVVTPLVGLSARVMPPPPGSFDKIVELRHVSPLFVAAVNQMHAARAAQPTPSS